MADTREERLRTIAYESIDRLDGICTKILKGIEIRMRNEGDRPSMQDQALLKTTADIVLKGIVNKAVSDKNESKTMNIDIQASYRDLAEAAARLSTGKMLGTLDVTATVKELSSGD